MTKVYNKITLKEKRKKLRNNMPSPEVYLWNRIKNKQILNVKFRRQYSIDNYIVDFYSPELKLAIEIDGDSHFTSKAIDYDIQRTKYIESLGIKVVRYFNNDIMCNMEGVYYDLVNIIKESQTPLIPP
ncbi:MAG TPA: endonuclease domain-containing protein [Ignavibacteria bacterium]